MLARSELLARLERLGPVRIADRRPLSSGAAEVVALVGVGTLDRLVRVFKRLTAAGASFRDAHTAIDELAADGRSVCAVARASDFEVLERDLAALNVALRRRRSCADPAAFVSGVRERHGLSQRGFADRLGFDVRTLQNWEQGRNRPDSAVLALIALFDKQPEAVEAVVYEPGSPAEPVAL